MKFSDNLSQCIRMTSSECAADLEAGMEENDGIDFNLALAEVAIDASRMTIFRGEDGRKADEEVRELIREHGYDAVLKEAAKHVCS